MAGSERRRFVPEFGFGMVASRRADSMLLSVRVVRKQLPSALDEAPPIDVITPAWNEAAGIALTLNSIDRAAAPLPRGRVRAIVSNDGSTDATEEIAAGVMARFRHAERRSLSNHPDTRQGRSPSIASLAVTEADLIVRIDGDCIVDEEAFLYSAPWFEDPEVGIVGSLMLPRDDCNTWYARMRGIECILGFGCTRMGQQVVDGVGVVPGTYDRIPSSAYGRLRRFRGRDERRGLWTRPFSFGRMGYRVVIDPRCDLLRGCAGQSG